MCRAHFRTALALGGSLLAWAAGTATAVEPERLSSFQPLTIQDAFPTRLGQVELEAAFRWDRTREDNGSFEPRPRIKLGALPGLQLSVGGPVPPRGREQRQPGRRGGRCAVPALRRARRLLPALHRGRAALFPMAARGHGDEPGAACDQAADQRGTAGPALHLNVAWRHMIDGSPTEGENRYIAAAGYSHPVSRSATLLANFVCEEERQRGRETNLIEAGVRQRVAENLVLSAGIGFGIGDELPSARIIVGIQHSFRLF